MAATKGAFVLWYCSHRAIRLVLVKSKMRAGESIRDWGEVQLSFTQPWNVQPLERVLMDIYESPKSLVTFCTFATPGGGGEYQWHWQFTAGTTHRKESARARSGHGWRVCWVPLFEDVGILEREKVII